MKNTVLVLICSCSFLVACQKDSTNPISSPATSELRSQASAKLNLGAVPSSSHSENGVAGSMPAYYDSKLFTINFKELSAASEEANLAHNGALNTIYMSDNGLPDNQPFVSVLDAIQGDGFNPLWVEVQIVFNPGFTPRQLFSDDQIQEAASGNNPEISLQVTDEVYRCSVIGKR